MDYEGLISSLKSQLSLSLLLFFLLLSLFASHNALSISAQTLASRDPKPAVSVFSRTGPYPFCIVTSIPKPNNIDLREHLQSSYNLLPKF